MDVWLIANVGQRDLQLDGQALDAKGLRAEGTRIARAYVSLKDRLSAPMLSPALEYLASQAGTTGARVLLVATSQEDSRFRDGDTLTCAAVLGRLLHERHGAVVREAPLVRVVTSQPNLYDRLLAEYTGETLRDMEPADRYCLLLAGGTPAANAALLVAGVWFFGEKAQALSVGADTGLARPMNIGERIFASYRRDRILELLARRDFAGAALLAPVHQARALAEAAAQRMNLDLKPSHRILETLRKAGGGLAGQIEVLHEQARLLAAGDKPAMMREVYWNALVKWRRGEYADFLGRVWRLREAALQEALSALTGLNLADEYGSRIPFERWVRGQPALVAAIEKALSERSGEKLRQIGQSAWLLSVILEWKTGVDPGLPAALRACSGAAAALEPLSGLRNKCILAHGFKGLSKDAILGRLPSHDEKALLDNLAALLGVWNTAPGDDPYEQFAEAIKEIVSHAQR